LSGQVEGVKGHLCRGLSDALRVLQGCCGVVMVL
jgi:hypothetical protein